MATRRFMQNPGATGKDVTEAVGAATASKSVELTVDLAAVVNAGGTTRGVTKAEVLLALEDIEKYIVSLKQWPPA